MAIRKWHLGGTMPDRAVFFLGGGNPTDERDASHATTHVHPTMCLSLAILPMYMCLCLCVSVCVVGVLACVWPRRSCTWGPLSPGRW